MTTLSHSPALPKIALPTSPVVSVAPITLPARAASVEARPVDLELRVSAPLDGDRMPVLLLSHGHGPSNYVSSLYGYAPLANYLAGRGAVVIQPTHLDSKTLPFRNSDHLDAPLFWRSRVLDMKHILDELDTIEGAVPGLKGRINQDKVAIIGHSMGGHTASMLLGAQHRDSSKRDSFDEARDPSTHAQPMQAEQLLDSRIAAGVLLAAPGRGDALSAHAAEHYPFFSTIDFSTMTTPTLVVAGEQDNATHLTTAGAAWFADPYRLSPGKKALLHVFGAGHSLGGISGYDVAETTDEHPARVAGIQYLTHAFLRSQLYPGDRSWQEAQQALQGSVDPLGRLESKGMDA